MDEVTALEIQNAIGISAPGTLIRWHQGGLIPPPTVRTHPNGRGKIGYWPIWVIERCRRIKVLREQGKRLEEILQILGVEFNADEKLFQNQERQERQGRQYDFATSGRRKNRSDAQYAIDDFIDHFVSGLARQNNNLRSKGKEFLPHDLVEKAIEMMRNGFNPVIVITSNFDIFLTADFLVSDFLARNRSSDNAIFVIPIQRNIWRTCRETERLPEIPRVRPGHALSKQTLRNKERLRFWAVNSWGFKVTKRDESKKRAKKKKPKP